MRLSPDCGACTEYCRHSWMLEELCKHLRQFFTESMGAPFCEIQGPWADVHAHLLYRPGMSACVPAAAHAPQLDPPDAGVIITTRCISRPKRPARGQVRRRIQHSPGRILVVEGWDSTCSRDSIPSPPVDTINVRSGKPSLRHFLFTLKTRLKMVDTAGVQANGLFPSPPLTALPSVCLNPSAKVPLHLLHDICSRTRTSCNRLFPSRGKDDSADSRRPVPQR
jgi:hypothetical protein